MGSGFADHNSNQPSGKADAKANDKGYSIKPKDATPGEVRSLLEIAQEFSGGQVRVNMYETAHNRILDVRADSPTRAKFIEFLLQRVRDNQQGLEHLLSVEPLDEHGSHPEV